MSQLARLDHWKCRREAPCLRLGIPARLITLERTCAVKLDDLSVGGARIALASPHEFIVCVLRWIDYHCFAEVVWQHDLSVGLKFDQAISERVLQVSRQFAPDLVTQIKQRPRAIANDSFRVEI